MVQTLGHCLTSGQRKLLWKRGVGWMCLVGMVAAGAGCSGSDSSTTTQADMIFVNGSVVTVNPAEPEAQALAVAKGKILAVGNQAAVMQTRGPNTCIVDLAGHTLMPGFVEPHTHLIGTTATELSTGSDFGFQAEVALLQGLAADPSMPFRIRSYLTITALPANFSMKPNTGDDRLRFIGVKAWADGSTQGLTAALTAPYRYPQATANTGKLDYASVKELQAAVQPLFDAGWQAAIHSNGDLATDLVLAVYGELLKGTPNPAARRLRMEHFTVTRPEQLDQVRQLGVTVSMTIGHVFFWGQAFDGQILGSPRASRLDTADSVLQQGIRFSFHSDSPITPVSPLRYVQNAVTRLWQWPPPQVLGTLERLTVDQAIRAVTLDAAYQLFMDDLVGSLEVGKYADLVVLAQNPRTTDVNSIADIQVIETYLAGVKVSP